MEFFFKLNYEKNWLYFFVFDVHYIPALLLGGLHKDYLQIYVIYLDAKMEIWTFGEILKNHRYKTVSHFTQLLSYIIFKISHNKNSRLNYVMGRLNVKKYQKWLR